MRRLLLLTTDLEIGGTPTVVRELALRLREPGRVEVSVACLKTWGPVAGQLRDAGINVHAFYATSIGDAPALPFELRDLIRDSATDTCLSFLLHANAAAALAKPMCAGVRFFQSIQTTQTKPKWHWPVQAAAARAAEKVIVPSPSVARVATERSDVDAEKIVVIPNAVDVPDVLPAREFAPGGVVRIGFVGRLDPVKRIPDLIRAMALLEERVRLNIVGEGRERKSLERLVARSNLGARVTLEGPAATVDMSRFDMLVLPSEAEGFGLVLIEAMAAGVPIVATYAPGIVDVVRDGREGLLVPVGLPAAIADAVRRLAENRTLRERIVSTGFARVKQNYSWGGVIDRYRNTLEIA